MVSKNCVITADRHLVRVVHFLSDQGQNRVVKDVSVEVFAFNALDLVVDNLQHLIRHNEIVFLPDIYLLLPREFPLGACAKVDFDDLQIVVSRLHNVTFVESGALKNARQLKD